MRQLKSIKTTSALLLILLFCAGSCKTKKAVSYTNSDIERVRTDVEILSDDAMEGRETGTKGERMASAYIVKRMREIGLSPGGVGDGYIQVFSKTIKANPHSEKASPDDEIVRGQNVLGLINNGAKYTGVIGAHYDHLGYGKEGSLYVGEPAIHNGADDNASGVAGMLRLAEKLIADPDSSMNYLFIGFSGEEKGLWGSNYFVKHPTVSLDQVNYMINMDMIGRLNDDRQLAIYGTGTSPTWARAMKEGYDDFKIKEEKSGVGPTDHTSFYLENLPVLQFFTGQHADYHKPTDDAHLINYEGIVDITDYILEIIEFVEPRGKLTFSKTKDESSVTPNFKVTLGVIPDYLYDGKGMRLDGVKEDRPAANAKLVKGDIIIKMGDMDIVDMMSYMQALGKHEKGQTIDIVIRRDGKELTRSLTF